jgi:hypothetical protein
MGQRAELMHVRKHGTCALMRLGFCSAAWSSIVVRLNTANLACHSSVARNRFRVGGTSNRESTYGHIETEKARDLFITKCSLSRSGASVGFLFMGPKMIRNLIMRANDHTGLTHNECIAKVARAQKPKAGSPTENERMVNQPFTCINSALSFLAPHGAWASATLQAMLMSCCCVAEMRRPLSLGASSMFVFFFTLLSRLQNKLASYIRRYEHVIHQYGNYAGCVAGGIPRLATLGQEGW